MSEMSNRMWKLHALVRSLLAVGVLLGACPPLAADDDVDDRKGRFVRVNNSSTIVVLRFNGEWFFNFLGVRPVLSLEPSNALENEAREFLTSLLERQRIVLEFDRAVPGWDGERNFVGYVYLEDGTFLNEEVLKRGYGSIDDRTAFSRLEEFKSVERTAKEQGLGMWKERKLVDPSLEEIDCSGTIVFAGTCGVSKPELIPESKVLPEYPRKLRRKKIEGRVVLQAVVSKDGSVRNVVLVKSPQSEFTEAARVAVEQWRYRPALKGGSPVDAYFVIVVDFFLYRWGR